MIGKLYGIGVGPGDPELLTVKAALALGRADVIIAPYSKKKGTRCSALGIVREFIRKDAEICDLPIPRAQDEEKLAEACTQIANLLEEGKNVAFIARGDSMLYSKYVPIFERLSKQKYEIVNIPGIISFSAISSAAGFPIADGDEAVTIIPVNDNCDNIEPSLASADTIILLKVHKNLDRIIDLLAAYGFKEQAVLVGRCGLPGEIIEKDLEKMRGKTLTYLSTIIARRQPSSD
ncbi:precorrin-2 C(20)-methyltransferase [Heliobacillus mobilis]|uniref:Precorrin-2 C(20)-methyltransferase n=1 Tax=Heliobacterium mobile TaxID=28064 RepID=A0A6I3SL35_HELMO|nr:precorrin-2 C(20)-methyltransferase [Heliobacterium mobile]MTV49207.1 precorrin-2 C(20)-methyltransferase [Heliobacterium mobile]